MKVQLEVLLRVQYFQRECTILDSIVTTDLPVMIVIEFPSKNCHPTQHPLERDST